MGLLIKLGEGVERVHTKKSSRFTTISKLALFIGISCFFFLKFRNWQLVLFYFCFVFGKNLKLETISFCFSGFVGIRF